MVTMFGRQRTEGGLDARIAELSARRVRVDSGPAEPANTQLPEKPVAPISTAAPAPPIDIESTMEERLTVAREELSARLGAEIRPERRALLTRGDMAKIVDAAVQAYFVRHSMDANPLARRDLITDILQSLLTPEGEMPATGAILTKPRSRPRRLRSSRSCWSTWMLPRRPRCRARLSRRSSPDGSKSSSPRPKSS
jgi:hypothetical protein